MEDIQIESKAIIRLIYANNIDNGLSKISRYVKDGVNIKADSDIFIAIKIRLQKKIFILILNM
jgi:hypothetical protein